MSTENTPLAQRHWLPRTVSLIRYAARERAGE